MLNGVIEVRYFLADIKSPNSKQIDTILLDCIRQESKNKVSIVYGML